MKRVFNIEVKVGDVTMGECAEFEDSHAAAMRGMDLLDDGRGHIRPGKISVRPEVELTYSEGLARFPHSLHRECSPEAMNGWMDAQAREQRAEQFRGNFAGAWG